MFGMRRDTIHRDLELIGRLEVAIKAEIGALRDEMRSELTSLKQRMAESNQLTYRLVDKLIEMSMVNQGAFRESVAKSRVVALDPATPFTHDTDDWGQPIPPAEEKWPPEGYVSMDMP